MSRQRNMAQMKAQIKTLGKEINEVEISSLLDAEFKHSRNLVRTLIALKRCSQK